MFNPANLLLVMFLIFAVQCTPSLSSPSPSPHPSPSPSSAGSLCNFKCPEYDLGGYLLGADSAADTGRLYCTYPMSEHSSERYNCKYNKHTGVLLSDSNNLQCHETAVFYCPGTLNSKRAAEKPRNKFRSRSGVLPQFVKARAANPEVAVEN